MWSVQIGSDPVHCALSIAMFYVDVPMNGQTSSKASIRTNALSQQCWAVFSKSQKMSSVHFFITHGNDEGVSVEWE